MSVGENQIMHPVLTGGYLDNLNWKNKELKLDRGSNREKESAQGDVPEINTIEKTFKNKNQ